MMNHLFSFVKMLIEINNMPFVKNILPQTGDLIRVKRKKQYYHYGIALNERSVVHFSGLNDDSIMDYKKVMIRCASLSLFLRGDKLEVLTPFNSPFPRQEVVERAQSYVGCTKFNNSSYNIVTNNCEHFARYIYYGKVNSKQVTSVGTIAALSSVILAGSIIVATNSLNKKKDK